MIIIVIIPGGGGHFMRFSSEGRYKKQQKLE